VPRALLTALLALGGAALLFAGAPRAGAATAQVTLEVPAGKLKSVRLRHLPRGAQLAFAISSNGRLGIALVSKTQLESGKAKALFRASFAHKFSFKVAIPASDDYYLVLDNRRGERAVTVTATVEAEAGKKKAPDAPSPPEGGGRFDHTRAAGAAFA
jgi:hypothetical protein